MPSQRTSTVPRIIIHGGAGNMTRENLKPEAYNAYRSALLAILGESQTLLSGPKATALDVATHAVTLLENNPLFNSGRGAVFTTAGTHELEASVMVSAGHRKRGVGVMLVNRVKNPILLARELLIRGDEAGGGGAEGHVQLAGESVHRLAGEWGLEMVPPSYYRTRKRWDEHRKGLGLSTDNETYRKNKGEAGHAVHGETVDHAAWVGSDPSWDGHEYLPQGTVGCVVLDAQGVLCVATSTGGLTNKLPGRIGDTPTIGAGFFAEQWTEEAVSRRPAMLYQRPRPSPAASLIRGEFGNILNDCLPSISISAQDETEETTAKSKSSVHGVALSGTGNGDSFLRLSAARTVTAITRFTTPSIPLAHAITRVAGPNGMLQASAEERFGKTGEGQGGMIGIEYRHGRGSVAADMNCGGMFRAWVDDEGGHRMMVFRDEF